MPPPRASNRPQTIPIPRAAHLPLPLPPSLRSQLSAHLHYSGTVKTLRTRLDTLCREAGWAQGVRERTMQLLREGEVGTWAELEQKLVREAMGREEEDEEEEDDDDEDEEEGRGKQKRKLEIKVADIEVPEKVKRAGWEVVRAKLEGAEEIVVKEEVTDGWEV